MNRIRILHTADLHLDSCFAALGVEGGTGNRLRAAQEAVFSRMLARAKTWPADAVVIAGDLFDSTSPGQGVVDFVLGELERLAPIPVYITPGNRDPFAQDSPYALELWPDNVTVFAPGKWQAVSHGAAPLTVHGIGHDGRNDPGALFGTLEIPDDGRVHVAVAHGAARGHLPEGAKEVAPFNADDVARHGLAYLALGHIHVMTELPEISGTVIRYPGTPQGRNFEECGPRYFLQVEITHEDGRAPSVAVTAAEAAEVLFEEITLDAAGYCGADEALDMASESGDRQQVVRIRLEGERPLFASEWISGLLKEARRRFLHAEVADGSYFPREGFIGVRDNTCIAKLAETMRARILDETGRDAAVHEAEALELALKACYGDGVSGADEAGAMP